MITEDCKGCVSYDLDNRDCAFADIPGVCPCSKCLIKGMCINPCNEFACYGEDDN